MRKKKWIYIIVAILIILLLCIAMVCNRITNLASRKDIQSQEQSLVYVEKENNWKRESLENLPDILDRGDSFSIDLRHYDLSEMDLSAYYLLEYACFDTDTIWPEKLYNGYNPEQVMKLGKNPGLGIENIHEQGITGKGVKVAIIDSALLPNHIEYEQNIMLYERLHCLDFKAQMHGSAVTSTLCGQTTGVAPDVEVYYIASTFGNYTLEGPEVDLGYVADGIERVLEINTYLPEEEQIRVVSISTGITPERKGYEEVKEAIDKAKEENVFVVTCTPEENFHFNLKGLGRDIYAEPDAVQSYGLGLLNEEQYQFFITNQIEKDMSQNLWVPMDSRTVAFCTGEEDYMYIRQGGNSFTAPWLAGLYALCVQVNPEITIDAFISAAFETGDSFVVETERLYRKGLREIQEYELGTIINPQRLIESIE